MVQLKSDEEFVHELQALHYEGEPSAEELKKTLRDSHHFREALNATPPDLRQQMEWSFQIAEEIEDALKTKGMTQKELASRLGTSAAAVSRWLSGGHNFTLSTLAKISVELEVPLIYVKK